MRRCAFIAEPEKNRPREPRHEVLSSGRVADAKQGFHYTLT